TWQINSPIKYHGVWNGQPYEDKGTVIEINKPKVLRSTFWSSLSGREDKPENYQVVSYVLEAKAAKTKLTLTQSNCSTQEDANQSKKNWESALNELQGLLEK
ncbi:MAG TPA: SRPBCC domain-containing protein, partial [Candidatus Saccharimonadales bacterium]|nr:SRPBCC domain-containing protein [Candidatus Saccharimonadales bacterium]